MLVCPPKYQWIFPNFCSSHFYLCRNKMQTQTDWYIQDKINIAIWCTIICMLEILFDSLWFSLIINEFETQALCCVDKKGILSWPNPTAEKVFFLRNGPPATVPLMEETSSMSSSSFQTDGAILKKKKNKSVNKSKRYRNKPGNSIQFYCITINIYHLALKPIVDSRILVNQSW